MQPSDALPPSATAPVPLASDLPRCGCLFCAPRADDTCTRERIVRRRPLTGSPPNRNVSRRGEGLPGFWTVLFVRAMVDHPAGYGPDLPSNAGVVLAFDAFGNSRHPEGHEFRGRSPTARTFTCLRIACRVSTTGARLVTDSGGLTLSRAGFAPAGRKTKFHGGIASSNSL